MKSASRRRRFFAMTIDCFILMVVIVVSAVVFARPYLIASPWIEGFWKMVAIMMGISLILFVCKDSFDGISIGRLALGIVVRDKDKPSVSPGFWRMVLRNLMLLVWPVEAILLAFKSDRRRLGDHLTRTTVVHNSVRSIRLVRMAMIAVVMGSVAGFFLITGNTFIMQSDAYHKAVDYLNRDSQMQQITGGILHFGYFSTGTIVINDGIGHASINIYVDGQSTDVTVEVTLNRLADGQWQVENYKQIKY